MTATNNAYMQAKGHEQLTPGKEVAFKNRLQDTGWGRATAHIFPIYGLVYAITRRTITPLLYTIGGTFLVGVTIGLAAPEFPNKATEDGLHTALGLVATPLLAKAGIDQARKHAEKQLG